MQTEQLYKKRIEWIDYAKAIAIILVGIGHYSCPRNLLTWIYTFHMPLFLILSGCTFRVEKYNFVEFLKRKIKSLIIPWWIAVICNVFFQFACKSIGISSGASDLGSIPFRILVAFRHGKWDSIYWFIPCVFVVELVLFLLLKRNDTKKMVISLIIASILLLVIYKEFIDRQLPWAIDLIPCGSLFILLGYYYINYVDTIIKAISKRRIIIIAIVFMILGSCFGYFNGQIIGDCMSITSQRFGNIPLMIISAVLCSTSVIFICHLFNSRLMGYIGSNSLFLYLLYPITYKVSDILLIVIFKAIPFYEYKYASNYFNLLILHIVSILLALLYVWLYKLVKNKIKRKIL